LLARLRALLRRNEKAKVSTLKVKGITLDLISHRVIKDGSEIVLTPKEFSILEYLLRNKNKVVSRTKLVEHVYDYHFDTETNIIDVFINKLRTKIETGSVTPLIHTIRGVGYIIKGD
jgi:two-component system, OmpR family, response regulator